MDHQNPRGRSPSAGQSQPHISQSHTPSPGSYVANDPSGGLGLDLDQQQHQVSGAPAPSYDAFANSGASFLSPQSQSYEQGNLSDPTIFDPNGGYGQSPAGDTDPSLSYDPQAASYLSPNLTDDFSLFPPGGGQGDQYNAPLFEQSTLNPNDITGSMLSQSHQSPPSPHLQPGSAQQSPSFSQGQFSSPPGGHSRNVSLGPEAALLPNQMAEWGQPQFQGHRRTPSEYSDVSSVSHSPNLITADNFDGDATGHSPLQRASDGSLYQEVLGIGNFSISDAQGNNLDHQGRSPSHSPAISPRISPQSMPEINQPSFGLMPPDAAYQTGPYPGYQGGSESFPTLPSQAGADMTQMVPPAINIDFAPSNAKPNTFEPPKPHMDQDSLTPPDRGRTPSLLTCLMQANIYFSKVAPSPDHEPLPILSILAVV
jgi:hypothetical protein